MEAGPIYFVADLGPPGRGCPPKTEGRSIRSGTRNSSIKRRKKQDFFMERSTQKKGRKIGAIGEFDGEELRVPREGGIEGKINVEEKPGEARAPNYIL